MDFQKFQSDCEKLGLFVTDGGHARGEQFAAGCNPMIALNDRHIRPCKANAGFVPGDECETVAEAWAVANGFPKGWKALNTTMFRKKDVGCVFESQGPWLGYSLGNSTKYFPTMEAARKHVLEEIKPKVVVDVETQCKEAKPFTLSLNYPHYSPNLFYFSYFDKAAPVLPDISRFQKPGIHDEPPVSDKDKIKRLEQSVKDLREHNATLKLENAEKASQGARIHNLNVALSTTESTLKTERTAHVVREQKLRVEIERLKRGLEAERVNRDAAYKRGADEALKATDVTAERNAKAFKFLCERVPAAFHVACFDPDNFEQRMLTGPGTTYVAFVRKPTTPSGT